MIILIKVVIFDIGGVVIRDPMQEIYRSVGRKFGINRKLVEKYFEKLCPSAEAGKIPEKVFWIKISEMLGVEKTRLKNEWIKSLKRAPFNKGVVRIINKVRAGDYKVATLSNTIDAHEKIHRKLGQYRFFSRVFLSNRLKIRKPDVRIYRLMARKLGVRPDECVFIDDKLRNVNGARKAGMNAILCKNAKQLQNDLKRYL